MVLVEELAEVFEVDSVVELEEDLDEEVVAAASKLAREVDLIMVGVQVVALEVGLVVVPEVEPVAALVVVGESVVDFDIPRDLK